MVVRTTSLNDIARMDASPADARELLLSYFRQPTGELLDDVYFALRSWVWKSLDQRRRDPDLRAWRDILGAVSTLMVHSGQPALAQKIEALGELISESIAVSEVLDAVDVTQRQHVAEILNCLVADGGVTEHYLAIVSGWGTLSLLVSSTCCPRPVSWSARGPTENRRCD